MEAAILEAAPVIARSQTPPPQAARRAVSALFFLNGVMYANWVSRIPAIQVDRGLSHGELGLALLAIALGALVAMPIAGGWIARVGSARISRLSTAFFCLLMPTLALAPNLFLWGIALLAFGMVHGALDVAMNAQAVVVEKRYARPIMSSIHALFSTGGLVGALMGGAIAAQGIKPLPHFIGVSVLMAVVAAFLLPYLLSGGESTGRAANAAKPIFTLPPRSLLALGAIGFCVLMGEGAMADWTGVYLRQTLSSSEGLAALGYATFSVAMAGGRFIGDWLTAKLGPVRLVRVSGLLAAVGLSLSLFSSNPMVALIGFAGVGAGFATVVPIIFSAAGRSPNVPSAVALSAVTSMGYFGFLAGPPLIGFVAEGIGLRGALGLIVGMSLLMVALATSVRPPTTVKD